MGGAYRAPPQLEQRQKLLTLLEVNACFDRLQDIGAGLLYPHYQRIALDLSICSDGRSQLIKRLSTAKFMSGSHVLTPVRLHCFKGRFVSRVINQFPFIQVPPTSHSRY